MKIHRFTVNVPNPGAKAIVARLSLETAKESPKGLLVALPKGSLRVVRAGIALDPCGDREARRRLEVTLRPRSSVNVHVIVETESGPGVRGTAVMHLVDQRPDGHRGGVVLVASSEPFVARAGTTVDIENPCPITVAGAPYGVAPGDDAGARPASTLLVAGGAFDLVVPITNPTTKALADVRVYLEHLGLCEARLRPTTWNVGPLKPKDVFYASWRVQSTVRRGGAFTASVVVVSRRANPVRLTVPFRLASVDAPRPIDRTRARR